MTGQSQRGADLLRALKGAARSDNAWAAFGYLRDSLSILDAKSASLLSFNSIITAVFAIFMTQRMTGIASFLAYTGTLAVLCSALLALSVVLVYWSTGHDFEDMDAHAARLLAIRGRRTIRYRVAWTLSLLAVVLLAVLVVVRWVEGV